MPSFAGLGKFFGKTVSEGAAFAVGVAVGPTLEPGVQEIKNEAWALHQSRPLEAETAAAIVAEDVELRDWGTDEAKKTGVSPSRFDALLGEALNAPGIGQLFELWRRGKITDEGFAHGLRKAKLEPRWDAPLRALHDVLLTSEELAMMQQQGFVTEDRANDEGALQGVTSERQQLRFEASGLPPGVGEALEMLRRGIIDAPTFAQIVREGHTKTKYTDEIAQLRWRVLSAHEWATLWIKGWVTEAEAKAGGAETGYDDEAMQRLYLAGGRPATAHQVLVGNRRGARIEDGIGTATPDVALAVRQSDIRPEYTAIIAASAEAYPSGFALRQLATSGVLTEAETFEALYKQGWNEEFARKVAAGYTRSRTSAAKEATAADELTLYDGQRIDRATLLERLEALGYSTEDANRKADLVDARKVASARGAAVTSIHTDYKKGAITDVQALAALERLGIAEWARSQMVAAWSVAKNDAT